MWVRIISKVRNKWVKYSNNRMRIRGLLVRRVRVRIEVRYYNNLSNREWIVRIDRMWSRYLTRVLWVNCFKLSLLWIQVDSKQIRWWWRITVVNRVKQIRLRVNTQLWVIFLVNCMIDCRNISNL